METLNLLMNEVIKKSVLLHSCSTVIIQESDPSLQIYKDELLNHFNILDGNINRSISIAAAIFGLIIGSNLFIAYRDRVSIKEERESIEKLKTELETQNEELKKELSELKINNLITKANRLIEKNYLKNRETDINNISDIKFFDDDESDLHIAINTLDEAIEINSRNFDALMLKGNCLYLLKRNQESIKCFENAFEVATTDREKCTSLMFTATAYHLRLERKAKAKKLYEQILNEYDCDNRVVLWNLGEIHSTNSDAKEAMKCYLSVINKSVLDGRKDDVFDEVLLNFMAQYYYNSSEEDKMSIPKNSFDKVKRLFYEQYEGTYFFGLIGAKEKLCNNDIDGAIKDFEKVFIELEPDQRYMPFCWDYIASLSVKKKYPMVIQLIQEYLKINPLLEMADLEDDYRFEGILKDTKSYNKLQTILN